MVNARRDAAVTAVVVFLLLQPPASSMPCTQLTDSAEAARLKLEIRDLQRGLAACEDAQEHVNYTILQPSRRAQPVPSIQQPGTDCYGANSTNLDPSCRCLGLSRDDRFDSRPQIVIAVGDWAASEIDAWLLAIVIEESLGYPVKMIPENDLKPSVWSAMDRGVVHIYPEASIAVVAQRTVRMQAHAVTCGSACTRVWLFVGLVFGGRGVDREVCSERDGANEHLRRACGSQHCVYRAQ